MTPLPTARTWLQATDQNKPELDPAPARINYITHFCTTDPGSALPRRTAPISNQTPVTSFPSPQLPPKLCKHFYS